MNENLAELKRRLAEISDLGGAMAVLGWDQYVMMPPAAPRRARSDSPRSPAWRTSASSTSVSASSWRSSAGSRASCPSTRTTPA